MKNYIFMLVTIFALVFSGCSAGSDVVDSIKVDSTKPVITLNGDNTIELVQGTAYTELGATATDDVDGNVSVVVSGSVDVNIVDSYDITYTATDSAANVAVSTRAVNVVLPPDITKPVITLNGASTIELVQGTAYTELGATATDDSDGNVSVVVSGSVDVNTLSSYTITYTASDSAGNVAVLSRVVNVIQTVIIRGVATDDPISNGLVTLKDLNEIELKTATTDLNGNFSIEIEPSKVINGYSLSVSGGKIGEEDFIGELNVVYNNEHNKSNANITLITSLVNKLAEDESGTKLEKRDKAIKKLVDIGMIQNEDWFEENPENLELLLLQNEVKSRGLTNWLNEMKSDLADNQLNSSEISIFTNAHGGIKRSIMLPVDTIDLFPGESKQLSVIAETNTNDRDTNLTLLLENAPVWISIEGNIINIQPPSTESANKYENIEVYATKDNVSIGRLKTFSVTILKKVILVEGNLDQTGGKIENEWKDVSISVDAGKLSQAYYITYSAGYKDGNAILFLESNPPMIAVDRMELNIIIPSNDILINNYLLPDEPVTRSLLRSVNINNNLCTNGNEAPIVWPESNFRFAEIIDSTMAFYDDISGYNGNGLPRLINEKRADKPIPECASRLWSPVNKDNLSSIRKPVLLVHGFASSGNLGGLDDGVEYFASLPHVLDVGGYQPFLFEWKTNSSFTVVKNELARAIAKIGDSTGQQVHILAHSFGGVLARTLLQTEGNNYFLEKYVASLTTVGTPHSGIFDEDITLNGIFSKNNIATIDYGSNITFKRAQSGIAGNLMDGCEALTCHEEGVIYNDIDEDLAWYKYGIFTETGSIPYHLANSINEYPNIPTQALIGLSVNTYADGFKVGLSCKINIGSESCTLIYSFNKDGMGDKLIGLTGQRLIYNNYGKNVVSQTLASGAVFEEHLLGLKRVSNSNLSVLDNFDLLNFDLGFLYKSYEVDTYEYQLNDIDNFISPWIIGYNHRTGQYRESTSIPFQLSSLKTEHPNVAELTEVGLHECADVTTETIKDCQHPTWLYFKRFAESHESKLINVPEKQYIYVSGKVLQNSGIPEQPYTVNVYVVSEDEGGMLASEIIDGTSDYNISVLFKAKTVDETYQYYVQVIPTIGSKLRVNPSNKIETDTTVKESDLSFNDILLVNEEYKSSEIYITLKDATDGSMLSDYTISIYNGDNPIVIGHTTNTYYSTFVGLGDYTCTATKTGYKESTPIACYSKKDEISSYEINIYRDEAVGTARRIVVLADDITPWDSNGFTTLMSENGYTEGESNGQYYVVSSDKIATTEKMIPGKDLIIVMNDQPQEFYNKLAGSMDKIKKFVYDGGVMLFEACDRGWAGGSLSDAGITELPGGTTFIHNYDGTNTNINPDSTLMQGIDITLTGSYASHESFENVPDTATIYTTDSNNKPTLVEYKYGLGWIVLTGQPLEHGYANNTDTGFIYTKLYNYILGNISNDIENRSILRSINTSTSTVHR